MRYQIINHGDGSYGVLDTQTKTLVVEHESMGVCDSIVFARTRGIPSEGMEIADAHEEAAQ